MLFNLSIRLGQIPAAWKVSNVTAIPKSTGNGTPSGYRPISLLTILSKKLERHISHLLLKHLASTKMDLPLSFGPQTTGRSQ